MKRYHSDKIWRQGKRILIVEDEPIICEICLKVLAKEGYEVEIANNGWEGEGKLKEKNYDLIIIDVRTPVMDGRQLYQKITEKYPDMMRRVIMTSGEMLGSDMQSFLEKSGIPFFAQTVHIQRIKRGSQRCFRARE